jgi:signal transduction histidine kinase
VKRVIGTKLSFVDKGIAIVLATCLSAVTCLAFLDAQRASALASAAHDCIYLEFIIELSGLIEHLSNYCGTTVSFALQEKPHWRELAVLEKARTTKDLTALRAKIPPQSPLADIANHFASRFLLIQNFIEGEGGQTAVIVPGRFGATLKRAPLFFNVLDEMADESLRIIGREREKQKIVAAATDGFLLWQIVVCVVGFFAALIGSVFFLRTFYFGIRKKLSKLSSNALKLADVNPELVPMEGSDEFSGLNKILETVLSKLRQSSEARTFLLCMVAHDMRSPLAAATINLELVDRELSAIDSPSSSGTLSPGGSPASPVAPARRAISQVLPFIDDLLQIEKMQANEHAADDEEILLEDFSDTELASCIDIATAAGIGLSFEFSSQILKVNSAELTGAISLIIGYLARNLTRGSRIILSAECQSPYVWKIFFTVNTPSDVAKPLQFLEEDLSQGFPGLSARTIKLHPALYHVSMLGARLRYEGFLQRNSGRLVLQRTASGGAKSVAGAVAEEAAAKNLDRHVSRPWLASFMLLLALPTLMQSFAFLGLIQQVREAGGLLREVQDKMQVILLLSSAEMLAMRVATATFSAALSTSEKRRQRAEDAVKDNRDFLNRYRQQLVTINGMPELLVQVERVIEQEAELFQAFSGDGIVGFLQKASDVEVQASDVGAEVRDALVREQKVLVRKVDVLRDSGASIKLIALLGALDLLVLIAMVISFRFYFQRRYKDLETHLEALVAPAAQGAAGRGGLFSNDELSVLERAVDMASLQIRANSAYRRAFIGVVREEIIVPISRAQGDIKALLNDSGSSMLSARNRERLTQAWRSLRLVLLLVDDLDSLDQIDNLEGRSVNLDSGQFAANALVNESWEVLSAMAEGRGVSLAVEYGDRDIEQATIAGDRKRLLQALINLIGNAIKFSPSGSTVRVRAYRDGRYVAIAVVDQGPGLGEAQIDQLFESFYQGESAEKTKGFGLGLAAARFVLEAHGGRLSVASTGADGTTFVMQIPAA